MAGKAACETEPAFAKSWKFEEISGIMSTDIIPARSEAHGILSVAEWHIGRKAGQRYVLS